MISGGALLDAGAAVISATEPEDRPGRLEPYDQASLAEEIANLEDRPLGVHDDSELSIAGLQNKLLLIADGDGWGRPVGGRPSTHVLEVEDRRYPGLVTMEAACLRLARAVGLTSVDVALATIAELPCVIVSRFDRRVEADGTVVRVHQEDACQALGRDVLDARRFHATVISSDLEDLEVLDPTLPAVEC